jgi:hypothetical protein
MLSQGQWKHQTAVSVTTYSSGTRTVLVNYLRSNKIVHTIVKGFDSWRSLKIQFHFTRQLFLEVSLCALTGANSLINGNKKESLTN